MSLYIKHYNPCLATALHRALHVWFMPYPSENTRVLSDHLHARKVAHGCPAESCGMPTVCKFGCTRSGWRWRASSGATVQFMVHSSGMNCPVASQKGAMPPLASSTGLELAPNSVPARPDASAQRSCQAGAVCTCSTTTRTPPLPRDPHPFCTGVITHFAPPNSSSAIGMVLSPTGAWIRTCIGQRSRLIWKHSRPKKADPKP